MKRSGGCAAVATAMIALLLAAPAAFAQVSPGDATATRDYLQTDLAYTRTEIRTLPAGLAAISALRGQLQGECSGVLANEPKLAQGATPSEAAVKIADEQSAAVFGVAEHSELQRRRDLAHALSRLSWSSAAVTRLVHSFATAEVEQAEVPPPDLCADLRDWVSGGYQTVSAATERYVRRESVLTAETGAEGLIFHKLKRYENNADRRIARQISAIEADALKTVVPELLTAIAQIEEVLHGGSAVSAT